MKLINVYLPRYVVEQFDTRYEAAKRLIMAVLNDLEISVYRPDVDTPTEFKHQFGHVQCQTWLTPEQDRAFRDKAKQRGLSLSRTAREAIRFRSFQGQEVQE